MKTTARHLLTLVFSNVILNVTAQTVVSVQNGAWNSPSTWDCACVPDFSQSVVIMHSVEINSALLIGHQQVQVTAAGEITMSFPETVSFSTVLINEGHLLVIGDILNQGLFNNQGFAEFIGTVLNDGSIISDAGAVMQVEGDFVNQDLVQGEGALCVTDNTDNQGTISGTLDFCDWTPTVSVPPFIDQNTGAVESGITFCQNSPCATGVQELSGAALTVVASSDHVVVTGVPSNAVRVNVVDATGRDAMRPVRPFTDRVELSLSQSAPGLYRVIVTAPDGQRSLPFIIAR